jgi:signal transduction histidine kinase
VRAAATAIGSRPGLVQAIVGLATIAAAIAAAYVAASSRAGSPTHDASLFRISTIAFLIVAGVCAQTTGIAVRMAVLLTLARLTSILWLLNGESNQVFFSVGLLFSTVAPVVFAYVTLALPSGRLHSRLERRFLGCIGGGFLLLGLLGLFGSQQPLLKTPLLECAARCPTSVFFAGSTGAAGDLAAGLMGLLWLVLAVCTPILLWRRSVSRSVAVRRSLAPVLATSAAAAVLVAAQLLWLVAGVRAAGALGAGYAVLCAAIPLMILLGIYSERLFLGQALAEFVKQLARSPHAPPEPLMAAALQDPSLRFVTDIPERSRRGNAESSLELELPDDQAVTWIERDHRPSAAVVYDGDLGDSDGYMQAAAEAALRSLERPQLEADLLATTSDLAASRVRLMDTAAAERRRLERDLHDGVQQQLVGVRLRLEVAAEAVKEDPARAELLLNTIGKQMDEVLGEVRSFARGIYPPLLSQRGLIEALHGAARTSAVPVEFHSRGLGRYSQDVEVAVYFCCLEALQNIAKHAGPEPRARLIITQQGQRVDFEVRDHGVGFGPSASGAGSGLINMRDRIEAVGGTLDVISRVGRGVVVRGSVPATGPPTVVSPQDDWAG